MFSKWLQVASNPKPPRSVEAIKMERFFAMRRNVRQSSSSFSNSASYYLGGRWNSKCIMVGPAPNLGYSREPKNFRNFVAHLSMRSARNTMGTRGTPE
jgi:hypothetical protein